MFHEALGDAQARVSVLEQELNKKEKIIQKSKKTLEVQQLTHEKESLQRKLQSQEEEFRLQNQTLLTELSNVSKQASPLGFIFQPFRMKGF